MHAAKIFAIDSCIMLQGGVSNENVFLTKTSSSMAKKFKLMTFSPDNFRLKNPFLFAILCLPKLPHPTVPGPLIS